MDDYTSDISWSYEKNNLEDVRRMWEETFNDPEDFVDYYFDNIWKKNKVLSAYLGDELIGMVHLNPYQVSYMGEICNSYYVVGVAVSPDMRGRGVMKMMMKKVMNDIGDECPFIFLMPKKQEYYNSLGFRQIYNTRVLDLSFVDLDEFERDVMDNYSSLNLSVAHMSELSDKELSDFSIWLNDIMEQEYNGFCVRDMLYLKDMLMEHRCQHGDVCIVTETEISDDGETLYHHLIGLFSYDIYDEILYVERFMPTRGNMMALLVCSMKQALDTSCSSMVVTVNENDLVDVKHLAAGVVMDISNGSGIMAVGISEDTDKVINNLKSQCFFDEIV